MKAFALSLLSSYTMGLTSINVDNPYGPDYLILDLRRDEIDERGYTLAPGDMMEIIMYESASIGAYDYDRNQIEPLFDV